MINAIKSLGELDRDPVDGDIVRLKMSRLLAYEPLEDRRISREEIQAIVKDLEKKEVLESFDHEREVSLRLVLGAAANETIGTGGSTLPGNSFGASDHAPPPDLSIADTIQTFAETLKSLAKELEEGKLSPEGRVIEAIKSIGKLNVYPEDGDTFSLEMSKLLAYKPMTNHMPPEEIQGILNALKQKGIAVTLPNDNVQEVTLWVATDAAIAGQQLGNDCTTSSDADDDSESDGSMSHST